VTTEIFDCQVIEFRTIDGDTQEVLLDLGFHTSIRVHTRLEGIDAPEKNTDAGKAVSLVVDQWLRSSSGTPYQLRLMSKTLDKYGRSISDFVDRLGDESLTEYLLRNGLVRAYDGQTARLKWSDEELADILSRANKLLGH
jgi:micrococcal nuclease